VQRLLAQLKMETAGNPAQQKALSGLDSAVRDRLEDFAVKLRLYEAGKTAEAIALLDKDTGRTLMKQASDMQAEENRLLVLRFEAFKSAGRGLLYVALLDTLLAVGLAAFIFVSSRRSTQAIEKARAELEEANIELETRVSERTADLRAANAEIQAFAYVLGHDLRAPLVNIVGFASELESLRSRLLGRAKGEGRACDEEREKAALAREFDESVGFIKAAAAKMERLINAIFKLSRDGRRELKPERIDMVALVEGVAASLAHQAQAGGATIEIGELPTTTSDRLALEQVFSNLLDNGLRNLRRDAPGRITISGRETGSGVVYEVQDNGRGVDPADHQRIFELFRLARRQDGGGEGIGLAHVRSLLRRLGGTIELRSEPMRGATFTVKLPRVFEDTRFPELQEAGRDAPGHDCDDRGR
jgi:signal transduction histidine kinase